MNAGSQQISPPDQASGGPERNFGSQSGAAGAGSAKFSYSRTRERFGLFASNETVVEYYPNLTQYKMLPRDVFTGRVYYMPHRSTTVSFNPHFKDLPEFSLADLFDAELGQNIPVSQDLGIKLDRFRRYGASLDIGQQLSKRSHAFMSLDYARGKVPSREWTLLMFTGRVRHAISKGVGVYVGGQYGGQREENLAVPDRRRINPRINIGLDYNRELSFARRTTVAFSTGTAGTHDRSTNQTTYRLVGSVRLSREFGRTWLSELSYSRNVRQIESFNEPLFNESTEFSLQGSFSPRLQFQSQIGKSVGRLGISGASAFDTYRGSVQLSVGFTKHLGIGTQYSYYRYSITRGILPLESNGNIFPHRVGAYLQLWLPLLSRTGKD